LIRALSVLFVLLASAAAQTRAPNFVIIFCDDLGYGDLGCFGSKLHRTPNIDRLAEAGMRLTHFYSPSSVCSAARASLMTGCYPRRVSMHQNADGIWVLFPLAHKGLNPAEVTMAEVLKGAGYATACVGKWHLGDQLPFLPTRQGFDSYFGIPYSNDMGPEKAKIFPPIPLLRDETVVEAPVELATLTRRYTEAAIEFIEHNREKPFFLYLPHTMPHDPAAASEAFAGKSANGSYGDAVEEIDWSTGQIMATLERLGLERHTLVVFTSDNGAHKKWGGSNAPLRGYKGNIWEGGMRVPCVVSWPGVVPAHVTSSGLSSTMDLLPTLAAFANAALSENEIDGVDLGPMLRGGAGVESPRKVLYFYRKDLLRAVRVGRWKLHLAWSVLDKSIPQRLFDVVADPGESNDVAVQHPDVVARLLVHAETARRELGDRGICGKGQRPAGFMDEPGVLK